MIRCIYHSYTGNKHIGQPAFEKTRLLYRAKLQLLAKWLHFCGRGSHYQNFWHTQN